MFSLSCTQPLASKTTTASESGQGGYTESVRELVSLLSSEGVGIIGRPRFARSPQDALFFNYSGVDQIAWFVLVRAIFSALLAGPLQQKFKRSLYIVAAAIGSITGGFIVYDSELLMLFSVCYKIP
ncbi:MAG: hypothetical protein ACTJLK_00865 [Anaplasma sp.]